LACEKRVPAHVGRYVPDHSFHLRIQCTQMIKLMPKFRALLLIIQ
jgi:hypothetical protein